MPSRDTLDRFSASLTVACLATEALVGKLGAGASASGSACSSGARLAACGKVSGLRFGCAYGGGHGGIDRLIHAAGPCRRFPGHGDGQDAGAGLHPVRGQRGGSRLVHDDGGLGCDSGGLGQGRRARLRSDAGKAAVRGRGQHFALLVSRGAPGQPDPLAVGLGFLPANAGSGTTASTATSGAAAAGSSLAGAGSSLHQGCRPLGWHDLWRTRHKQNALGRHDPLGRWLDASFGIECIDRPERRRRGTDVWRRVAAGDHLRHHQRVRRLRRRIGCGQKDFVLRIVARQDGFSRICRHIGCRGGFRLGVASGTTVSTAATASSTPGSVGASGFTTAAVAACSAARSAATSGSTVAVVASGAPLVAGASGSTATVRRFPARVPRWRGIWLRLDQGRRLRPRRQFHPLPRAFGPSPARRDRLGLGHASASGSIAAACRSGSVAASVPAVSPGPGWSRCQIGAVRCRVQHLAIGSGFVFCRRQGFQRNLGVRVNRRRLQQRWSPVRRWDRLRSN